MESSKKAYNITKPTDCIMFLASFNFFAKDFQGINFNPGLESQLIDKLSECNVVRYSTDVYLNVLTLIKNSIDPKYSELLKCDKNGYIKDTFFYSSIPPHDEAPFRFLSIMYRISDKDGRRIFRLRITPYISTETGKFELAYGLLSPHFLRSLAVLKDIKNNEHTGDFTCSVASPCNINEYKMLNYVFSDGLDPSRKNYLTDLTNLRDWCAKYPQYKLKINDSGILVSRNKRLKLSSITDPLPALSSYIITH